MFNKESVMTKEEILSYLKEHHLHSSEKSFKKWFPNEYSEIISFCFPETFSFLQKLYHYLHDDFNFKLGVCPVCGNHCKFLGVLTGYRHHCSTRCSSIDPNVQEKNKRTNMLLFGVENSFQSSKIKEKIKKTKKEKYGNEYYLNREKAKETLIENYGVDNPQKSNIIRSKTKQTCLTKYGCEYPSQNEKIKSKTRKTCLDKYGTDYPVKCESVKNKIKQTNLRKYGNTCFMGSKYGQEKSKQTCFNNLGVYYPSQSEKVKEKIRQNNLNKYGVENVLQSKEIQEKAKQTCLKKYGVERPRVSQCENELYEYISEIYDDIIIRNDRDILNGLEIDIYLPKLKLGIEFNGDYWHMNPLIYKPDDYNDITKMYAYEHWNKDSHKICIAKERDVKIITIWEYDWKNNCNNTKNMILKFICDYHVNLITEIYK